MRTLKKVLALSMVFAMAFSMMAGAAFNDQDKIDASLTEDIQLLTALEVFQGDEKGDFNPTDNVTRAQAAKMIYVLKNNGQDDEAAAFKGNSVYSDVPSGHWAEGYINYCTNLGIMSGWTEGSVRKFDPNGNVTGLELTKMLLCMIGYRADIQGYTGNGWQTNVLRDGATSAVTTNYLPTIYNAAPRQWTARLMANAINAPYVSYSRGEVVQGSSTDATTSYGEQYLGLRMVEGYLKNAGKVALDLDATTVSLDDDGDKIVLSAKKDLKEAGVIGDDSNDAINTFKTTVDPMLLGQRVKVYYKTTTLTTTDAKVYAVLPTGSSKVYDVKIGDVTTGQTAHDSTASTKGETIKFAGYNGGSAKTYNGVAVKGSTANGNSQYPSTGETSRTITMVENLDNAYVVTPLLGNQAGTDQASLKNFSVFSGNSNENIRFVDQDNDGYIDLALTDRVTYALVSSHNAERNTIRFEDAQNRALKLVDGDVVNGESAYKKINFVNDVVADDVVSVKLSCISGTKVWDIAKVEPITGSVSGYSTNNDGTEYSNVTLNGESTKFAKNKMGQFGVNPNDDTHILNDTTFYTDGKYIVYSKGGEDVASVGNLAYIIGKANTEWFGTTVYAKVLLSDGTQGQYEVKDTYHLEREGGNVKANAKLVKDSTITFNSHDVMSYTISDNKITLSELKSDSSDTGIHFHDKTVNNYVKDSKTYNGNRMAEDAYFFVVSKYNPKGADEDAKYKDAKYNVVKASELGNKNLTSEVPQVYATKKNSSDGINYVVFGTLELKTSAVATAAEYAYVKSAPSYAVVDGDHVAQMTVVLPNGEETVLKKSFTTVSGANDQVNAWKALRGTLVAYDLDSDGNATDVRHVPSAYTADSWDEHWVKAQVTGWNGSAANLNIAISEIKDGDKVTGYNYQNGVLANVDSNVKIHIVNTTDESYTVLSDGSVERTGKAGDFNTSLEGAAASELVGPSAYVYMVKDGNQWKITDIFSAEEGRELSKLWKADSVTDLNK